MHMISVVMITPQNETQNEQFVEYTKYFTEKQRAGIIGISKSKFIYLLPPSPLSQRFYSSNYLHMLGIVIDQSKCKEVVPETIEELN